MTTDLAKSGISLEKWEFSYHTYLRLLAIFFIIFTIQTWMRAIGISAEGELGFDKMPTYWRIAIAALCVLHPMTALGLWGLFAWGIAVWLIGIFIQLTMHLAFPALFGAQTTLVILHITSLAIFIIFQIAIRFAANRK